MKKMILFVLAMLASSSVFAHPGHGLTSAYAGFMHPLTGVDHLLVMLAIGVWAAKLGGKARWQLPLTFVFMMAIGAGLGWAGWYFKGVETAIATSVIAMGLLLMIRLPMRLRSQLSLTALFAILHGMAHGAELTATSPFAAFAGMLIATAFLHGAGLLLASQKLKLHKWLQHGLACLMFFVGTYWLIAA